MSIKFKLLINIGQYDIKFLSKNPSEFYG